jgi:hypothetical protein
MIILRGALSALKFLMILGLVESIAPGLSREVGVLLGNLVGEAIKNG